MPRNAILATPHTSKLIASRAVISPTDRCAAHLAQLIGFRTENPGGNESALGLVGPEILTDNEDAWSGDHRMDPPSVPGVLGVTFATSAVLLYVSAALLGFFLVAVLPVGMQYAAEITHPTPEGTSNGLIQLFGQSAVVFVYIMEAMSKNGSFTSSLLLSSFLLLVSAGIATQLKDPQ